MMDDGLADGTADVGDDGLAVIRFERTLPHPIGDVWAALTDPTRLARWWGEVDLELRLGGRFDVTWFNLTPEGERLTMHASITTLDPPRLLETRGDVHGVLRWELNPEDGGTRLVFTSTLELPDEFRTRTLAGMCVQNTTAADLAARCHRVALQGRCETITRFYAGPRLLIVDEVGYLPLPDEAAAAIFQIVSQKYLKGSIALTINLGIASWGKDFIGDAMVAAVMLDRLLHRDVAVDITGDSCRMHSHRARSEKVRKSVAVGP